MFSVHLHDDHPYTLKRHSDDDAQQCRLMARANKEVTGRARCLVFFVTVAGVSVVLFPTWFLMNFFLYSYDMHGHQLLVEA